MPGLFLQSFTYLASLAAVYIAMRVFEAEILIGEKFDLFYAMTVFSLFISTEALQPVLLLWRLKKLEQQEAVRAEKQQSTVHEANAQMLRSWKVTPRPAAAMVASPAHHSGSQGASIQRHNAILSQTPYSRRLPPLSSVRYHNTSTIQPLPPIESHL